MVASKVTYRCKNEVVQGKNKDVSSMDKTMAEALMWKLNFMEVSLT